MQISMIRFVIGFVFLIAALIIFFIEIYGVFKYKYSINRMHSAALGDTLGITLALIGLMIFFGVSFTTLKLGLILCFLWCSSPVSSHLIAALQVETDEDITMHAKVGSLESILGEEEAK